MSINLASIPGLPTGDSHTPKKTPVQEKAQGFSDAYEKTRKSTFTMMAGLLRHSSSGLVGGNQTDPMKIVEIMTQQLSMAQQADQAKVVGAQTALQEENNRLMQANLAAGFLGKEVETDSGDIQHKKETKHTVGYTMPPLMKQATVVIKNDKGTIVREAPLETKPGRHLEYTWDGKMQTVEGDQIVFTEEAPEGKYTIEISAKNALGKEEKIPTTTKRVISKVDLQGGNFQAIADGTPLTIDQITALQQASKGE